MMKNPHSHFAAGMGVGNNEKKTMKKKEWWLWRGLFQAGELAVRIEAGAGLGGGSGHLAVALDDGVGELLLEFDKEMD